MIDGMVPSPDKFPQGCRFHPRCPYAKEICKNENPELKKLGNTMVACHFPLVEQQYEV